MSAQSITYRPDIDGLRALSILCVILYHLDLPAFRGGFVGVDFFFAISGYLIFSILDRERQREGRVDWLAFYARRVLRLLPEATMMIVTVMILGSFVLVPLGPQQELAKSGIAGSLWLANVYFWRFGADYFAPAADRQPLIHLWSLGIEEQFYLTVPAMFLIAGFLVQKLKISWRRSVLLLLTISVFVSLAISVWGSVRNAIAAYYLLPTRAYEFASGGLAALWLERSLKTVSQPAKKITASLLGVLGVFLSVSLVPSGGDYPGAWAALPSVSMAFLLWSGGIAGLSPIHAWLQTSPAVFIGKISYGWYLWHFPLLILWREYWLFDTSILEECFVICASAIPAAAGFWLTSLLRRRFAPSIVSASAVPSVELRRDFRTRTSLLCGFVAVLVALLASGLLGAYAKYIASQSEEMKKLYSALNDRYAPGNNCFSEGSIPAQLPNCDFGDPAGTVTFVVWGDSHANHWVPALDLVFKDLRIKGVERAFAGCPPSTSVHMLRSAGRYAECAKFGDLVMEDLLGRREVGPIGVILSAKWGAYLGQEPLSLVDRRLFDRASIVGGGAVASATQSVGDRLTSANIAAGVILQVPEQKFILPLCLSRASPLTCAVPTAESETYLRESNALLARVANLTNMLLLNPSSFMCDASKCRVMSGDAVLYHDSHHLSRTSAMALAPFLNEFVGAIKDRAVMGDAEQTNDAAAAW